MAFTFGAAAPAATPGQKPPLLGAAGSTSLFGQPQTSTTTTPSLFGASAAPAAPSLFGSTPAPASAPASTGGLFGAAPAASPAAPATTGFSFGTPAASTAPAAGGLFGSAAAKPAGGLFGTPAASTAPATGGLFGSTTPAAGGGLFGSTTPASQPAPTGGLFGASQPAAPTGGLFGGSTFGQPAATPAPAAAPAAPLSSSLFGQSQQAATSSLFGPKPTQTAFTPGANPLFPSTLSQSNQFSASTSTAIIPQPAPVPKLGEPFPPANPAEPTVESRLEAIKSGWDTTSPQCRFQTYFYNAVPAGSSAGGYAKPPGAEEKAWLKAVRENPEPEKLVPALALGFPAIQKRIDAQTAQSAQHQAILQQISTHLSTLSETHTLSHSIRALRAQITAQALAARLSALAAKVSKVSPSRGAGLRVEEEELRKKLEGMRREVELGEERGRELWSGVGAVKARKEAQGRGEGGVEWAVADEEGLRKILEILGQQQAGLDHLTKTLKEAGEDVEVMKHAFGLSTSQAQAAR